MIANLYKKDTESQVPRIAEFECLSRIYNPGDPAENYYCREYTEIDYKTAELICMKPKMNDQNACYGDSGGKLQSDFNTSITSFFYLNIKIKLLLLSP